MHKLFSCILKLYHIVFKTNYLFSLTSAGIPVSGSEMVKLSGVFTQILSLGLLLLLEC